MVCLILKPPNKINKFNFSDCNVIYYFLILKVLMKINLPPLRCDPLSCRLRSYQRKRVAGSFFLLLRQNFVQILQSTAVSVGRWLPNDSNGWRSNLLTLDYWLYISLPTPFLNLFWKFSFIIHFYNCFLLFYELIMLDLLYLAKRNVFLNNNFKVL